MLKKMIIIAIATAAAVWVFAEPGTWGKETPAPEKEAKASAIQFHRWLNDFRAAYEQRDGEKMGDLIKGFEDKQKEMPAMPRLEKWLTNVKAAYQEQDVQKMGRLLENADRMRERIRGRIGQNFMERRGRSDEEFGERGRRFDGPQRGYEFDSRREFSGRAEASDRFFEGRRPMYRPEMPYDNEFERPYFRPGPRRESERRDIGPMDGRFAPRGPMRERFAPRMRPESGRRYDRPQNYPQNQPSQEYDRIVPRDFWY